jgi:hypothetical protein
MIELQKLNYFTKYFNFFKQLNEFIEKIGHTEVND